MSHDWIAVSERLPEEDGQYQCLIQRGDRELEAVRLFKRGHWFGGCRPFSDNDIILKWKSVKE